jgi:predicted ester cyclase
MSPFLSAWEMSMAMSPREVAEGEYVAVHCHVTGTHQGVALGSHPTQKSIDIWGMGMARVQNGKIVEAWNSFDFMSLYQQVDMLPQLVPPAFAVD